MTLEYKFQKFYNSNVCDVLYVSHTPLEKVTFLYHALVDCLVDFFSNIFYIIKGNFSLTTIISGNKYIECSMSFTYSVVKYF